MVSVTSNQINHFFSTQNVIIFLNLSSVFLNGEATTKSTCYLPTFSHNISLQTAFVESSGSIAYPTREHGYPVLCPSSASVSHFLVPLVIPVSSISSGAKNSPYCLRKFLEQILLYFLNPGFWHPKAAKSCTDGEGRDCSAPGILNLPEIHTFLIIWHPLFCNMIVAFCFGRLLLLQKYKYYKLKMKTEQISGLPTGTLYLFPLLCMHTDSIVLPSELMSLQATSGEAVLFF